MKNGQPKETILQPGNARQRLLHSFSEYNHSIKSLRMNSAETFLRQQLSQGKTPSIHYAFFKGDETLYRFAGGLADVAGAVPVDDETSFHFAKGSFANPVAIALRLYYESCLAHADLRYADNFVLL